MGEDLEQRCGNIERIWYINTNFDPRRHDTCFFEILDQRCGKTLMPSGTIVLIKDHPYCSNGQPNGSYFEGMLMRPLRPTLADINSLLHDLGRNRQVQDIQLTDYCHSYMKIEPSFPEILEGLNGLGYDMNFIQIENPKYSQLRQAIRKLPLNGTDLDYSILAGDRSQLAKATTEEEKDFWRKRISEDLDNIKEHVMRNLTFVPTWTREMELQFGWPIT